LPSDAHETLYRRLQNITAEVREALARDDFRKLPEIIEAQQAVMTDLGEVGDCADVGLIPLITRIRDDVNHVRQELGEKSAEIRSKMGVMANKRKISKAYGV
jgi:hypothetical protein